MDALEDTLTRAMAADELNRAPIVAKLRGVIRALINQRTKKRYRDDVPWWAISKISEDDVREQLGRMKGT